MISVGEICDLNLLCVSNDTSVLTAIKLMRESHRCSVIAVDANTKNIIEVTPLGIVSDRGLWLRYMPQDSTQASLL